MQKWLYVFICFVIFTDCQSEKSNHSAFSSFLKAHNQEIDLWIKNAKIYNGIDSLPFMGDLLITKQDIVYIGQVPEQQLSANDTIDAKGAILCPGFIDTHAHGDPMETPNFDNFLAMGVTSICLGQDGFSPQVMDINEWFKKIEKESLGPNIIPFIGHSSLRLMSGADYEPNLSTSQLDSMAFLLNDALEKGCFGMTTGLEYTPGQYAKDEELIQLAKIVGQHNGLIMSHIRNEDDEAIENSIKELKRQGQFCNVHIAHLKVVYGKGTSRASEILNLIYENDNGPYNISADLYPYSASYTGIGIVFPQWAKAPNNYENVKKSRRAELLNFLRNKVKTRNGPAATLLGTEPYAGKTLEEISTEKEKSYEEVLLEDIGPEGASGAYFVMNDELQEHLLKDLKVMVCSDGSPTMRHPRGYGSFAKVIESYVLDKKLFPLHQAIYKMSAQAAQTLDLSDRGHIAVGKKADLLIFHPKKIKAKANFVEPHLLAEGFDYVIVNGKITLQNGSLVKAGSGMLLKKKF